MSDAIVNRLGRRPGRRIRPWLLVPKVVLVSMYVGCLAAACMIWFTSGFGSPGAADPRRLLAIKQVGALVRFLAVPALVGAMIFGVLLLLQHPRAFLRMRWLQVKLVAIAIIVPAAHLFCSSRMDVLREAFDQRRDDPAAATQFGTGLLAVLGGSIAIVIVGRLKPRFGQNWARTYATLQPPAQFDSDSSGSYDRST